MASGNANLLPKLHSHLLGSMTWNYHFFYTSRLPSLSHNNFQDPKENSDRKMAIGFWVRMEQLAFVTETELSLSVSSNSSSDIIWRNYAGANVATHE